MLLVAFLLLRVTLLLLLPTVARLAVLLAADGRTPMQMCWKVAEAPAFLELDLNWLRPTQSLAGTRRSASGSVTHPRFTARLACGQKRGPGGGW